MHDTRPSPSNMSTTPATPSALPLDMLAAARIYRDQLRFAVHPLHGWHYLEDLQHSPPGATRANCRDEPQLVYQRHQRDAAQLRFGFNLGVLANTIIKAAAGHRHGQVRRSGPGHELHWRAFSAQRSCLSFGLRRGKGVHKLHLYQSWHSPGYNFLPPASGFPGQVAATLQQSGFAFGTGPAPKYPSMKSI